MLAICVSLYAYGHVVANTHLVKKLMKLASSHELAVGPEMDLCKSADGLRSGKITECGQADGHNEYLFESVKQSSLALSANHP
jgi:hypothetical protein